jgi:hypothetical protein
MKSKVFFAVMAFGLATTGMAAAVDWKTPWMEPQDTASAIQSPEEYAWRLFVALNWPADMARREPDTKKSFGAEGPVVWEAWKNAREVFRKDGGDPGPWLDGPRVAAVARNASEFDPEPLQQLRRRGPKATILFDPISAQKRRNETRLNKQAYEFVRTNELFNLEGQLSFFDRGVAAISFPAEAKEIKAQWRVISEADKPKYHWHEEGGTIYGLTALHITTKDIPNWVWATFEHVDNPNRPDNEPWLLPSQDRFACKGVSPDCNLAPAGIGLEKTKWAFYRLRGVQLDFVDSRGGTLLLANSQPETGFQTTSSCMTCHARATIGRIAGQPARLSVFKEDASGYVGMPQPDWFASRTIDNEQQGVKSTLVFTQLDFVWSLFRAQPKASR